MLSTTVGRKVSAMSKISIVFAVALFALCASRAVAQTTEFTYQGKLDAVPEDSFGFRVGLSGGKIVVAAFRADIGGVADQGVAYVFEQNNGGANNWGFVRKLTAPTGGASQDFFGFSVGISGNTIIVGELYDDIGANTDQGSAYIFDNQ